MKIPDLQHIEDYLSTYADLKLSWPELGKIVNLCRLAKEQGGEDCDIAIDGKEAVFSVYYVPLVDKKPRYNIEIMYSDRICPDYEFDECS